MILKEFLYLLGKNTKYQWKNVRNKTGAGSCWMNVFVVSILSSLRLTLRYPTPQSCCIKKLLFSIWLKSVDKTVKIYKENEGFQSPELWRILLILFAPEMQFQPNGTCCHFIFIKQIYFIKYCIQSCILIRLNIVITKILWLKRHTCTFFFVTFLHF